MKHFRLLMVTVIPFLVVAGIVLIGLTPKVDAEYADIIINKQAEKQGMQPVMFPHWFHRIRFKCKVCHEDIFIMKRGANDINMSNITKGQQCGKCHNGKIAWAPLACGRCHSIGGNPDGYIAAVTQPPK
ncbi:MAG: hypothetical protein HZA06_06100 [Nitrospirae bacterium]|nr:hypothetical protein [Nitrospirota bacterium]